MTKLEIIESILHEKYKTSNQSSLIEQEKDEKGKTFTSTYKIVKANGHKYGLYRYTPEAFPYFNEVTDLKKMCDYILFLEEGRYLHVLVFELKKGNDSARKQLKAAKVFVEYILESAKRTGKIIDEFNTIKMIRISDEKIRKFKKRVLKESDAINFIDDYCDYPYNSIYLERLT